MSAGLWPVFNPPRSETPESDGSLLLDCIEVLDQIAESAGLTPVTAFTDNREVPDEFTGDPDELDELLGPWEAWFEPEAGIACLSQLAEALRNPQHAATLESASDLRAELLEFCECLRRANGHTFRLEFMF